MIIKKIFYQLEENGSWLKGVTFECDGDMDGRIISEEGNILQPNDNGSVCYDIRCTVNEHLLITI